MRIGNGLVACALAAGTLAACTRAQADASASASAWTSASATHQAASSVETGWARDMIEWWSQPALSPRSLVAQQGPWTLYSPLVNQVTGAAAWGDEVWLATQFGAKRLDRRASTVRHFTAAEGLAEPRVLAIAASASGAWCMAQATEPSAQAVLYRFDRAASRWQRLGALPSPEAAPYAAGGVSITPVPSAWIVETPEYVCFAHGPVTAASRSPLALWDKRAGKLIEPGWPDDLRREQPFLNISFLAAQGGELWLGGNLGLLRFSPRRGRWQRFLPARAILAGTLHNNTFWLAASPLDDKRAAPDPARAVGRYGEEDTAARWVLTRFEPSGEAGRSREFEAPPPSPSASPLRQGESIAAGTPLGVSVDGARLWVSAWPRGGGSSSKAGFHRLDPATGAWISLWPQRAADMAIVPDALLTQPVRLPLPQPTTALLFGMAPARFASWLCPPAPIPDGVLYSNRWQGNTRIEEDNGRVAWSVEKSSVLLRAEAGHEPERFPLPPPSAFAAFAPPAAEGEERAPGEPEGFAQPDDSTSYSSGNTGAVQLVSDESAIWAWRMGRGGRRLFVARFDRAQKTWSVRSDAGLPERRSVARVWADGESLWAEVGQALFHLSAQSSTWEDVAKAVVDDARVQSAGVADLLPQGESVWILLSGPGAWSHPMGTVPEPPRVPLLVRYDKAARRFEPSSPPGRVGMRGSNFLPVRDGLLIIAEGQAFRFSSASRSWQSLNAQPEFGLLASLYPLRVTRAAGALWFSCREGVARWETTE